MAAIVAANSPAPKPGPQIHPPARSCERFAAVFPPAWQQGGAHSARQLQVIAAPGAIAAHAGRTDVPAAITPMGEPMTATIDAGHPVRRRRA